MTDNSNNQDSTLVTEYYDYNHGRGEHYLAREEYDPNRPRFSSKCCCNYMVDGFCLIFALGFLGGAIWFAFYELNNADSGNRLR